MNPRKAEGFDKHPIVAKNVVLLGKPMFYQTYGFCHMHRGVLTNKGQVVYMWDKEGETRKEFFFRQRKPSRIYNGNQFCFLEYLQFVLEYDSLPESSNLADCLEREYIELYRKNLEKILKQKEK